MAGTPNTTPQGVWNYLVAERDEIINTLNHNQALNPQLDERLAAVEEQLLQLPAPDLTGVTTKLELLWQTELHGLDQGSQQKLAILADLRRLTNA
jgi:hypothetical protein